ncbi:MAG: hypothetical protein GYA50_02820 [Eubacteriaceae bacterium]|nr:hypothetical protein [Eubacteriaceae bacterium]
MEMVILACFAMCAVMGAFVWGYKIGKTEREEEIKNKRRIFEGISLPQKKMEESEEERKLSLEMDNIDAYATNRPQKDVV